jgi:hypothetical protein
MLLAALLDVGVPYEYLEKMTKQNPAGVLGLDPGWSPPASTPPASTPPASPPAG